MPALAREIRSRLAVIGLTRAVGTGRKQRVDRVGEAVAGRDHQRCVAALLRDVRIAGRGGELFERSLAEAAAGAGGMEREIGIEGASPLLCVCTPLQQKEQGFVA